ncbi:hypothetical protein OPT61_g6781 [Boeremia exigua]|uniref:Uncharacterized protein n=1 Tax=Boeremia exigua TaxID=749465 RepID=A0ACC2I4U1_9PLEO|nr:hypothetical protein OPT61_g6781 [Boeremia exigua]
MRPGSLGRLSGRFPFFREYRDGALEHAPIFCRKGHQQPCTRAPMTCAGNLRARQCLRWALSCTTHAVEERGVGSNALAGRCCSLHANFRCDFAAECLEPAVCTSLHVDTLVLRADSPNNSRYRRLRVCCVFVVSASQTGFAQKVSSARYLPISRARGFFRVAAPPYSPTALLRSRCIFQRTHLLIAQSGYAACAANFAPPALSQLLNVLANVGRREARPTAPCKAVPRNLEPRANHRLVASPDTKCGEVNSPLRTQQRKHLDWPAHSSGPIGDFQRSPTSLPHHSTFVETYASGNMATTFSYAQAAKGISSPVTVSKPASGSATPAKDDVSKAPITSIAQTNNWADDAEAESSTEQPTLNGDSLTAASKPTKPAESLETSTADLDSLSASTVTKDDEVSSQPNMSSESTWDSKSQASTSVDKSIEPAQKTSEKPERSEKGRKGKKGEKKEAEKEKEPLKPLKEAPLPTVNIWQQRADQQKSQAKPVASPPINGVPKKSSSEGRPSTAEHKPKGREEDKAASLRKDLKGDNEKKGSKGKPSEKDAKPTSSAMPLPPHQDQESWPTPETAVDEDRKKAQEKTEKERKDSAPNNTTGKHEWVKVPYTPSVVFNTPLPNAANPRRGGRPGGRGGAQSGGRPAGFGANGVGSSEKDVSADAAVNGEQPKREANGVAGDASPKSKRSGSAASPTLKEQVPAVNGDKTVKGAGAAPFEPEAPKRASTMTEVSNQNGALPRQYPNRPGKGRRGDFNGSERRREGDASPVKDTAHADSPENERRPFDGPNGVHPKQSRYNNSYAGGRDRPRGGGRGGRGGFANGSHFANGNGSYSVNPGSPTTFNPGNNAFFTAPQGKFGRSSHRSQSVTETYRHQGFQGTPQMPNLNTFNMYDYNMVAPVSAMSYNAYGVDQYTLFQMITTQVEYYFSVDNLLKDMYLRKHMDSQGFVSLEFIAAFNRIKCLTTDVELLKLVCQQSGHVQYRTGEDGRDRLRRRDGWEQWVLNMTERDESAQNEGPKELHNPPVPNPAGFDQSNPPQYPTMSTGFGNDVSYPQHNPFVPNGPQDAAEAPTKDLTNGTSAEDVNGTAVTNGQPIEESTKAMYGKVQRFAFEGALQKRIAVGLSRLIQFCQSLLSSQTVARHRVARGYISVESKDDTIVQHARNYGQTSAATAFIPLPNDDHSGC